MGAISLVHVRFGRFTPTVSPSSAVNSTNSSTVSAPSAVAALHGATAAVQSRQKSAGGAVSSSWIRSLARSACHGSTGSDWTIQRLLPSSETEGAVVSFIVAMRQTAAVSRT